MITVQDVLSAPTLRLTSMSGTAGVNNPITAAHVSELTRPRDWLQGGELLMTVGLMLPMTESGCRDYVRDCVAGGVAALCLGLGHGLPYQAPPAPLVEAAREFGVPLLIAPDSVPFIAITKWIFSRIAEEEKRALEDAIELSYQLTAVAAGPSPLSGLLGTWRSVSGSLCAVLDASGGVVQLSDGVDAAFLQDAEDQVGRYTTRARGWTAFGGAGRRELELHPVRIENPLAFVVLERSADSALRHASNVLVSLLSLELERRHVAGEPERQRRAAALAQLLRPGLRRERAHQIASGIGLSRDPLQIAVVRSTPEAVADLTVRIGSALPDAVLRQRNSDIEIAHPESAGLADLLSGVAEGCAVGIGALVPVDALAVSAMQARSLVAVSARLGRAVDAKEGETVQLLLRLGSADVLSGFSTAVLAPLDQLEPRERVELQRTLEEWLRANGAWDPAAAALSVHRNTVRNRIDKVAALTGRNLDQADDRMELWLALKARAVTPSTDEPD
ncbi:PucR family transcriptional regulator [Rhodococcus sp. USK10]|uniref:PucR family transcriptional regulator n=1 Tax=Rhodococcus wratislaviensis TaxID=44752 RepID=A0A402CD08_RHOWR|nr:MULTISPECIES: PucR family transcriptional regulator [Rhodococcus]QYB05626.1 PucR family transcriptional regulator [Rhodococcus sp. USK10]GCE41482.1 hypothetical protein Rhow_005141 [Rhodococcus wratislaviensis]